MGIDEDLSKLIDEISCPICKYSIVDPHVLPCNHYYCRLVYTAVIHIHCFKEIHVLHADDASRTLFPFKNHVLSVAATVSVEILKRVALSLSY